MATDRKTAARKPAKASTASTTSAPLVRKSAHAAKAAQVSYEVRQAMIAEAAYYLSERRGFAPGHEESDWLEAESQVNRVLGVA